MDKQNTFLIFAEQKKGVIHPVTFELIGKAIELVQNNGCLIDCVVLGEESLSLEHLFGYGIRNIHHITGDHFNFPNEEIYVKEISVLIRAIQPEIILIGATTFGRSLAPRLAASLKTGLTADCTELKIGEKGELIQIRPAFSGNILAHISCDTFPQMATVRYKEFPSAKKIEGKESNVIAHRSGAYENKLHYRELKSNNLDITEYDIIVSGGKGIRQADDFRILKELADLLGGQIAASRAVVDEGYLPKEYQVGYSGNRVKPKLYIACGISGAPQHIAGMKDSDKIIAINSDPSAPIFNIADYGIVADLYKVVPLLIDRYKKRKEHKE